MKKVEALFKAQAANPSETAMLYNGSVGFVVPEYQRQYDWSKENIERLFLDTLNGFQRLSTSDDASAFTFLGTLILVEEDSQEPEFHGRSVAIVDGQQRLTTLALFSCALYDALQRGRIALERGFHQETSVYKWLSNEIEYRLDQLYETVIGVQRLRGNRTFPYPRIVRREDKRGRSRQSSEYRSPIARFLEAFSNYVTDEEEQFSPPALGENRDARKLLENYKIVQEFVQKINDTDWYEGTESEQFQIQWMQRPSCRSLFERLNDTIEQQSERQRVESQVISREDVHPLIRLLLFSGYFSDCIVLTRVITEDESAAFDIFDALNTTGEPLTALETLKPRVINRVKNFCGNYDGSESENAFYQIRLHLDEVYTDTAKKQSETKDLVVNYALYITGKKLGRDLAAQRNFLRTSYDTAADRGYEVATRFVTSLSDITVFRYYYWTKQGIEELGRFHGTETVDQTQLLSSVIKDMKTSLALPILARYWHPDLKTIGDQEFVEALRAVAAFLVLRRAATGGTAGIDGDFRAIMASPTAQGQANRFGLCAGIDHSNERLSPDQLKVALRTLLERKLRTLNKNEWVTKATGNGLYRDSGPLVRFIIMCAAHQAMPDVENPGLWTKTDVRASSHLHNYLNYDTWVKPDYATVEHIAPESNTNNNWNDAIYSKDFLKHSLGNLVLLPQKENSVIGNDGWDKKKKFYLALTEESGEAQQRRIREADTAGIRFSNATKKVLSEGRRLSLLDPLRDVDHWDEDMIELRGQNIASLCWDVLWPWLE